MTKMVFNFFTLPFTSFKNLKKILIENHNRVVKALNTRRCRPSETIFKFLLIQTLLIIIIIN